MPPSSSLSPYRAYSKNQTTVFSVYTRTHSHIYIRIRMFAMRIMNFECNESNQINGCLSSFLTPLTLPSRSSSPMPPPLLRTCFVLFYSCCPHHILPGDLLPPISLALTKPHMFEHTASRLTSHIELCMNSTTSQYRTLNIPCCYLFRFFYASKWARIKKHEIQHDTQLLIKSYK